MRNENNAEIALEQLYDEEATDIRKLIQLSAEVIQKEKEADDFFNPLKSAINKYYGRSWCEIRVKIYHERLFPLTVIIESAYETPDDLTMMEHIIKLNKIFLSFGWVVVDVDKKLPNSCNNEKHYRLFFHLEPKIKFKKEKK